MAKKSKANIGVYINPFTDFGFKKLFGEETNKEFLIDFLNALLFENQNKISDVSYLQNEHTGRNEEDRMAIFDISCETKEGERFIVEMQNGKQEFFKDRSLYYTSFPIQNQAKKDSKKDDFVWNYELNNVYFVAIMNFRFDEKNAVKKVKHHIVLKDLEDNTIFNTKLQFIYLEMPNFENTIDELETHYEKWLFLLKNLPALKSIPPQLNDDIFMKVFAKSNVLGYLEGELNEYRSSLKAYTDYMNSINTAEKTGQKVGRIEGVKEVALNLIEEGLGNEFIQKVTKLSFEEIEEIRKENM